MSIGQSTSWYEDYVNKNVRRFAYCHQQMDEMDRQYYEVVRSPLGIMLDTSYVRKHG